MAFPALHIVEPKDAHTHTAVLLHGRASNGAEFAEEFLDSHTSEKKTLPAHFPGCRWVFPTSRERWSVVFEENLTAWFDIYSLVNISEKQDLQVEGLKESTAYLLDVIRSEVALLGGRSDRLVLAGMSQGMATALWTLLCSPGLIKGRMGGMVGMSGWLPFADEILDLNPQSQSQPQSLREMISTQCGEHIQATNEEVKRTLSTPVILLHGADDAWVGVELGRQAHAGLVKLGMPAVFKEYTGADNDGHWVKEPEGVDDIVRFLMSIQEEILVTEQGRQPLQ
ncbi:hypothetical protein MGYG_07122 [Nannizzia gypsea CBS 118893]|uniref:Phospholipase/carboxylesterase/thioesterase domain-containing protein n=1 Tax=Arthroderma gypseum (strain ATCC MYA-4604 / CBS 118893) TaxID=535722 RepID=E4V250_ARTGP|nr:hypothetical protein MGYG_07122 [Nannizzia gypsea CBS 118893]EFR04115.1 hypothetical protein MGYG_07122 [Nannizzia gypsea CBS 118893]